VCQEIGESTKMKKIVNEEEVIVITKDELYDGIRRIRERECSWSAAGMAESEILRLKGRLEHFLRNGASINEYRDCLFGLVSWYEIFTVKQPTKRDIVKSRDVIFVDQLTNYEIVDMFCASLYEILKRYVAHSNEQDDCAEGSEGRD